MHHCHRTIIHLTVKRSADMYISLKLPIVIFDLRLYILECYKSIYAMLQDKRIDSKQSVAKMTR